MCIDMLDGPVRLKRAALLAILQSESLPRLQRSMGLYPRREWHHVFWLRQWHSGI